MVPAVWYFGLIKKYKIMCWFHWRHYVTFLYAFSRKSMGLFPKAMAWPRNGKLDGMYGGYFCEKETTNWFVFIIYNNSCAVYICRHFYSKYPGLTLNNKRFDTKYEVCVNPWVKCVTDLNHKSSNLINLKQFHLIKMYLFIFKQCPLYWSKSHHI